MGEVWLLCRQVSQQNQQTVQSVQLAGTCVGAEQDPEVVRSMVAFQLLDMAAIIIKE